MHQKKSPNSKSRRKMSLILAASEVAEQEVQWKHDEGKITQPIFILWLNLDFKMMNFYLMLTALPR